MRQSPVPFGTAVRADHTQVWAAREWTSSPEQVVLSKRTQILFPHADSKLSAVPFPGDPMPSSILHRYQAHLWYTYIQANAHPHNIQINLFFIKITLPSSVGDIIIYVSALCNGIMMMRLPSNTFQEVSPLSRGDI